jgi:beta-lactamase class A
MESAATDMVGLFEKKRAEMAAHISGAKNDGATCQCPTDIRERATVELAKLEFFSGGELGVHAINLADGKTIGYRETEKFPMASTFKVALALHVLQMVDNGHLKLSEMIEVGPELRVPPPLIETYFRHQGLSVSIANLVDLMLVTSDNAATDALLARVGGPAKVMEAVKAADIHGMRVDRTTSGFLADFLNISLLSGKTFAETFASLTMAEKAGLYARTEAVNTNYEDDPRDSCSPSAMTQLLATIFGGHVLSDISLDFLSDSMRRCENDNRLKAMLPPGTFVLHKTGTLGGSTSDVGIIDLPYGAGKVAIAVYVKKSSLPTLQREPIIAHAARTIYDYMLFAASQPPGDVST